MVIITNEKNSLFQTDVSNTLQKDKPEGVTTAEGNHVQILLKRHSQEKWPSLIPTGADDCDDLGDKSFTEEQMHDTADLLNRADLRQMLSQN